MSEITLIFPDQLFESHPGIAPGRPICLAEEFLFFKVQPFHKQRLVLLKAAMRMYAKTLLSNEHEILYIPSKELNQRGDLFALLAKNGVRSIHLAEFADEWLSEDLEKAVSEYGWETHFYPSPAFLCTSKELKIFFVDKEHFSMSQFYAYQRKRLNILMEGKGPVGGKYSFDTENRKKIPKGFALPKDTPIPNQDAIRPIIDEVESEFRNGCGSADPFLYPPTHVEAKKALQFFFKSKLVYYGDYQDAIRAESSTLFHSVLSPLLNIGLLTPLQVIKETLAYAKYHAIPMNSLEGFVRQIVGWREFVRGSYILKGSLQRTSNFFDHHQRIPLAFLKGATGILPIDTTIQNILQTGYCNHIERLMVLGNFLLLTETSPNEVYRWFMAYFVDAYDWVMVPNVYGMAEYSDGGLIVTKPYISGSNYILKMSNYPKGEWTEIWDGLFWRFLRLHRHLFASNPRTQVLVRLLEKNEENLLHKIKKADNWISNYRKTEPF